MRRSSRRERAESLFQVVPDGPLGGYLAAVTPAELWADQVRRDGQGLADAAPATFTGSDTPEAFAQGSEN